MMKIFGMIEELIGYKILYSTTYKNPIFYNL